MTQPRISASLPRPASASAMLATETTISWMTSVRFSHFQSSRRCRSARGTLPKLAIRKIGAHISARRLVPAPKIGSATTGERKNTSSDQQQAAQDREQHAGSDVLARADAGLDEERAEALERQDRCQHRQDQHDHRDAVLGRRDQPGQDDRGREPQHLGDDPRHAHPARARERRGLQALTIELAAVIGRLWRIKRGMRRIHRLE